MPHYVVLYKLTDQGIRNIKDGPRRIEEGIKAGEAAGIKVNGWFATMGEYDYVAFGEAPNDEVISTLALAVGSQGNVRTTIMRAYTREEFAEIVGRLP